MGVARTAAMVLFGSGMIAVGVLLAPSVGLWRHPRACTRVSIVGAVIAAIVLAVQVATPAALGSPLTWSNVSTDYFLAMAHFFQPAFAYPFFWSPAWVYRVGTLTPLIAAGGVAAFGAGYAAFRAGERAAAVPMTVGLVAIVVFATTAAFAAQQTWRGIGL
jgi:hypothetical protein